MFPYKPYVFQKNYNHISHIRSYKKTNLMFPYKPYVFQR